MQTANEQFLYDEKYYGRTLRQFVPGAHAYLARACGWGNARPPNPGTFGFDNLICSIGRALSSVMTHISQTGQLPSLRFVAAWVHLGWGENYVYWRDEKPWLDTGRAYCKPSKKLGDARRDTCVMTAFDSLPEDEKDKDLAIARFLLAHVEKYLASKGRTGQSQGQDQHQPQNQHQHHRTPLMMHSGFTGHHEPTYVSHVPKPIPGTSVDRLDINKEGCLL